MQAIHQIPDLGEGPHCRMRMRRMRRSMRRTGMRSIDRSNALMENLSGLGSKKPKSNVHRWRMISNMSWSTLPISPNIVHGLIGAKALLIIARVNVPVARPQVSCETHMERMQSSSGHAALPASWPTCEPIACWFISVHFYMPVCKVHVIIINSCIWFINDMYMPRLSQTIPIDLLISISFTETASPSIGVQPPESIKTVGTAVNDRSKKDCRGLESWGFILDSIRANHVTIKQVEAAAGHAAGFEPG